MWSAVCYSFNNPRNIVRVQTMTNSTLGLSAGKCFQNIWSAQKLFTRHIWGCGDLNPGPTRPNICERRIRKESRNESPGLWKSINAEQRRKDKDLSLPLSTCSNFVKSYRRRLSDIPLILIIYSCVFFIWLLWCYFLSWAHLPLGSAAVFQSEGRSHS